MRTKLSLLIGVLALAIATVACGDDDSTTGTEPTTTASAVTTSTTEPESTTTAPTTPPTTIPPTVAPTTVPGTSVPTCTPFGSTQEVSSNFPGTLSSLRGKDVRTGAHECYERIVIELQGSGVVPGYRVRYADQVTLGQTDDQFVDLRGDANLLITSEVWMSGMEDLGPGYPGPRQIFPTNVSHIEELYLVDDFEGMNTWAVGIDQERPFRVSVLPNPTRLVIDVYTG